MSNNHDVNFNELFYVSSETWLKRTCNPFLILYHDYDLATLVKQSEADTSFFLFGWVSQTTVKVDEKSFISCLELFVGQ